MKSVLIVKLGALGDICMASAMLAALRKEHPGIRITWLTGKSTAPLLSLLDSEIEVCTVDDRFLGGPYALGPLYLMAKANYALQGRKFDLILVPYKHFYYRLLCLSTRCVNLRYFAPKAYLQPGAWHPAEYMRLALNRPVSHEEVVFPQLPNIEQSNDYLQPVDVLLVPGGAKNILANDNQRRWPLQHYVATAKMLTDKGFSVGIIGNKEDEWTIEAFNGIPVHVFIGKTSILDLFWLLQNTCLLITHDTGIMHCMVLVGRPMIALFGATAAKERLIPQQNIAVMTASPPVSCSPCYDGRKFKECETIQCMHNIQPSHVFATALSFLSKC